MNESQVIPYVLYWGNECDAFRKYVAQNTGNNNTSDSTISASAISTSASTISANSISKFDVMIAADVIYEQEQIVPLLCTVKEFLKGFIIYIYIYIYILCI